MERLILLEDVEAYRPTHAEDALAKKLILDFLATCEKPFGKTNISGHITASALVVNPTFDKVLLTHHFKLDKWLQFGGHSEVGESIRDGALREAKEESGIQSLKLYHHEIFDLDVHEIPEYKGLPAHFHYDIRFLILVDEKATFTVSDESHDVKWIEIRRLSEYTDEISMHRMIKKIEMKLSI